MTPDGPSGSAGRGPNWISPALALFAALLPVWLHRAYFSGEAILYHGDAAQLQFPRYVTLCESLQRGDFPLWQTLVYGGSPFHANPENPTLYPPTLLLAAFTSPVWTINLTVLIHLALAGLGMFLFVQRLGRRIDLPPAAIPAGALVGAIIFALNHFTRRDHVNLVAYGAAHALIPWMMLAADGLLNGSSPRRSAGLLALAIAGIFFTGGLYVISYAFLALGVWMVFLGLLGGREARRRTLRYGALAAAAAALMLAAKLLPYREWLPTTNRSGRLPLAEALGTTLGAQGTEFEWNAVWTRTTRFLGGLWVLLPGIFSLALLRQRIVRIVLALALLGFAIGLGGATWHFFYSYVPPFDRIRSAVRAWTLVNAFYPLAAGLGSAWLFSRLPWLRSRAGPTAIAGIAASLLLVPLLSSTDPRERYLWNPEPLSEVRERYPRWSEAARRAGTSWRAAFLDRAQPEGRNEQFATSLLGVETVAGYQGHVWPERLERHLYGPEGTRIDREARMRRLGVLSARWLIETDAQVALALRRYLEHGELPADPRFAQQVRDLAGTDPPGIEGTVLLDNIHARARLVLPAVVLGVLGDEGTSLAYSLLDHPGFPLAEASVLSLPRPGDAAVTPATDAELAALDVLIVSAPVNVIGDLAGQLRPKLSAGAELVEWPVHWQIAEREAARDRLLGAVARRALSRRKVELGFERQGSDRALLHVLAIDSGAGARARFAVVSEPWSWYGSWEIEGLVEPPVLRLADGISTAFLLPAAPPRSPLVAVFRPRSVSKGLALGALGLALALGLIALPRGSAQRGA